MDVIYLQTGWLTAVFARHLQCNWSLRAHQAFNSRHFASLCSSTHLLPGPRGLNGGPVISPGCLLSSDGPPDPSHLVGHGPAGPSSEPHQESRLCVQLLLAAPAAEHEWKEARLPRVASRLRAATQDLKPAGCPVWVQADCKMQVDSVCSAVWRVPLLSPWW